MHSLTLVHYRIVHAHELWYNKDMIIYLKEIIL